MSRSSVQEKPEKIKADVEPKSKPKRKSKKKKKEAIKHIIIGIVIGIVLAAAATLLWPVIDNIINPPAKTIPMPTEHIVLDKKTSADFKKAVLGGFSQEKELIVYNRSVYASVPINQTTLADWDIFRKTTTISYKGNASYTVDLSKFGKDDISVNEEEKTVTVSIPHPELLKNNVIVNSEDIKFEDTERGLLAFGDIKITPEQYAKIETNAKEFMKSKLIEENESENADRFAKLTTWEILQPLVTEVSSDYRVIIEFQE